MGLILDFEDGQTPLDEDEKEGLLIKTISMRSELDEFEQQNIEKAIEWTLHRKFKPEKILTEAFVKEIHKKMYGHVWIWAGAFRKTNKNLGVDKWNIGTELKALLDDSTFWLEQKIYEPDELAIRFKHRLVSIHCFSNGNGRHSRLMADIMIEHIFKKPIFSWGSANLIQKGEARNIYLSAIREADKGNFSPLISFARA